MIQKQNQNCNKQTKMSSHKTFVKKVLQLLSRNVIYLNRLLLVVQKYSTNTDTKPKKSLIFFKRSLEFPCFPFKQKVLIKHWYIRMANDCPFQLSIVKKSRFPNPPKKVKYNNKEWESFLPYQTSHGSHTLAQSLKQRYFKAKKNLQENFSTINNIQKQVDQLKIAARTKHHLRRLKHKKR
jgi:hypothetical protein